MAESRNQDLANGGPIADNYYKLLGVAKTSTETEIRDTFHRLAVEYHPDRSGSEVDHNTAIFSKLSQAYSVLSDPISRSLYDIAQGYTEDTPETRRRINHLKRVQAEAQNEHFERLVPEARAEEAATDGLIIIEALYGDVSVDNDTSARSGTSAAGRCIDVTAALQCLTKSSILFLHGGGSKSWLEGFYDPNEDQLDNMLYIRYRFNNDMHECLYSDLSEICLPAAEHLIQDSSSGAAGADESEYYSEDEDSGRGGDDSEGGLTSGDSMRTPPRHGRRVNNAATTPNSSSSSNNRRRRHRSSMAGGLRSSVRVKPRAQVQQEEAALKAGRRRKLYLSLATVAISGGVYYASKEKLITLPTVSEAVSALKLDKAVNAMFSFFRSFGAGSSVNATAGGNGSDVPAGNGAASAVGSSSTAAMLGEEAY